MFGCWVYVFESGVKKIKAFLEKNNFLPLNRSRFDEMMMFEVFKNVNVNYSFYHYDGMHLYLKRLKLMK